MPKTKKLKLYVWKDVLQDYTYGVMFALASSEEEARSLLRERCNCIPSGDLNQKPQCIEEPFAFVLWGGG